MNGMQFNLPKAVQACALLLGLHPAKQMGYRRLLKLLYIADRESLDERCRPITGDRAVSMDQGPVLSRLYDAAKESAPTPAEWAEHIRTEGYLLSLVSDPGTDMLSRYEIDKLKSITERFRAMDDFDISRITHEYKEYREPHGSSIPISIEAILEALGKTEDEIKAILGEARSRAVANRAMERCR